MKYNLYLTWRNLLQNPIATLVPAIIIALAVALSLGVFALGDGVRQGIIRASDPFGMLVVGPKGGSHQLVLNTLLLQGNPLGTIPYEIYERLSTDERVALAVPLAFGDNLGGASIIGTTTDFFEVRTDMTAPPAFQLNDGELFDEAFEAVLGAVAAQQLKLTLGDQFQASHGVQAGIESDVHQEVYTVVGILKASATPYDYAIFTHLESIWDAHSDHASDEPASDEHASDEHASDEHASDEHASDEHASNFGTTLIHTDAEIKENALTAILIRATGFTEQGQIWTEFYSGTEAQAVFPGRELGALFDLVSFAERVLQSIGYLVLGMGALTVFLSMYNLTSSRQGDIAVMRSLGSQRANIFGLVLLESGGIVLLGTLLGHLLGYGVAQLIANIVTQQSAVYIPLRFIWEVEGLIWGATLGVGLVSGLLPAIQAYRVDVVEHLFK